MLGGTSEGTERSVCEGQASSNVKTSLRTSLDIYNRIIWDGRLDAADFTIVYFDRFMGMQQCELVEFRSSDDEFDHVPWHRVWQFRRNGEVVWDRERRIDKISTSKRH